MQRLGLLLQAATLLFMTEKKVVPTVCHPYDALKKTCAGDGAGGCDQTTSCWSTLALLEYTALLFTVCVVNSQGRSPASVQPHQEVIRATNISIH